jgi:hypothetical protein
MASKKRQALDTENPVVKGLGLKALLMNWIIKESKIQSSQRLWNN